MTTTDQKLDATTPAIPTALTDPIINRGSAFTTAERRERGLVGRLPAGVLDLEQQANRVYRQLQELPNDLQRNLLLEQIHDRNETLYYRVLIDHLPELLPVVYDPTVGEAIEKYSDEYRGQRGVYLSIDAPDDIEEAFATFGLGPGDVDLIVCSDAEEILGIGDWGVGGIQISIGKLAIYTAGAGIHPNRAIAVSLDVGTDNPALLNDPLYLGNRHSRRRGDDYDAFIKKYIETVTRLFPDALLHFEDFGPEHARDILATYSGDYRIFNDDVQGTGAVVMAALYAGVRTTGIPMRDQVMVVFGSGTAGVGIADQLRDAMIADGATDVDAISQIWLVDKQGLLFDDMDNLRNFQTVYAKPRSAVAGSDATVSLLETIKAAKPTVLLGTSTAHGAFTEDVIAAMATSTPRPIILPISNPTEKIEADPRDVIAWTKGAALVATGIPVDPITFEGTDYRIGQANNFLVFPGIGLGVIVSGAKHVTPGLLAAAAKAVAARVDATGAGASLLPDVSNLREISAVVAHAVYDQAVIEGLATRTPDDVVEAIQDAMWVAGIPPRITIMNIRPVGRRDIASALVLGISCGAVYVLLASVIGPALSEAPASAEIGAMWAVVATIFVFRASVSDGLHDARSRLAATVMSLVLCLVYLVFFDVTAVGVGVVIGLGSLLAAVLGRPQDAVLTGITSIVVLVVADLGHPTPEWLQPLLRLFDTAVGIAVGLAAAAVFAWITSRLTQRASSNHWEGSSS